MSTYNFWKFFSLTEIDITYTSFIIKSKNEIKIFWLVFFLLISYIVSGLWNLNFVLNRQKKENENETSLFWDCVNYWWSFGSFVLNFQFFCIFFSTLLHISPSHQCEIVSHLEFSMFLLFQPTTNERTE